MRPAKINYSGDPFNSDTISEFVEVISAGYGGAKENLTAPAAGNYPPITLNRYFIFLPFVPDITDLAGARPMLIKDVTGGVPLTRVAGAPGVNEYRIAPFDSRMPHIIELNSGQAGHIIAYDYFDIGSIANAEDFNSPEITGNTEMAGNIDITGAAAITGTLEITGASTFVGKIIPTGGIEATYINSAGTPSTIGIRTKIIEIGNWNMDSTFSVTKTHGLTLADILQVGVVIRADAAGNSTLETPHQTTQSGATIGLITVATQITNIILTRQDAGWFDSIGYDETSYNRGWIIITYKI